MEIKNLDMFLLHNIKSFDLKKYQICFYELQKMVFWFVKDQICFMIMKKKFFNNRKIRYVFIYFKRMITIF